ncbi:MAG: hypothetical protein JST54_28465 [Deltaproteobacteria bacterium]|nr:hypothetical protein [Deltaproteobacteria bacterium]
MRRAVILLALAGCVGGLNNKPLEQGSVSGQLVGAGSAQALVFISGHHELATTSAADGSFTIANVPLGPFQLVASASASAGQGGGTMAAGGANVGALNLSAAPGFVINVRRAFANASGAQVSIVGTPLSGVTGDDGVARLGALPVGCYELQVVLASGETDAHSSCSESSEAEHDDHFDFDSDGGEGDTDGGWDCRTGAGCNNGLHCDPNDGQCYACVQDQDCGGPGSVCHEHQCVAQVQGCATCAGDFDCGPGGRCVSAFSSMICEFACQQDADCGQPCGHPSDYGFRCTGGLCVPQDSEITSCEGGGGLGGQCQQDADCTMAGLVHGSCIDGICTVGCASPLDCPVGWECEVDGGPGVCRE